MEFMLIEQDSSVVLIGCSKMGLPLHFINVANIFKDKIFQSERKSLCITEYKASSFFSSFLFKILYESGSFFLVLSILLYDAICNKRSFSNILMLIIVS